MSCQVAAARTAAAVNSYAFTSAGLVKADLGRWALSICRVAFTQSCDLRLHSMVCASPWRRLLVEAAVTSRQNAAVCIQTTINSKMHPAATVMCCCFVSRRTHSTKPGRKERCCCARAKNSGRSMLHIFRHSRPQAEKSLLWARYAGLTVCCGSSWCCALIALKPRRRAVNGHAPLCTSGRWAREAEQGVIAGQLWGLSA